MFSLLIETGSASALALVCCIWEAEEHYQMVMSISSPQWKSSIHSHFTLLSVRSRKNLMSTTRSLSVMFDVAPCLPDRHLHRALQPGELGSWEEIHDFRVSELSRFEGGQAWFGAVDLLIHHSLPSRRLQPSHAMSTAITWNWSHKKGYQTLHSRS